MRVLKVGELETLADALKNLTGSSVVIIYYRSRMESGCSAECTEAETVIDTISTLQDFGTLIKVTVGDKKQWEDSSNVFRMMYGIRCIPTLLNHIMGYRLEGEQCCNELLVKRMFGVKIVIPIKLQILSLSGVQFAGWLNDLEKKFSMLSDDLKTEVFSTLHSMCAPFKSNELATALDKLSKRDFLTFLPHEVSGVILRYLDHQSLGRGVAVSHNWNYLITNNNKLWLKALHAVGMHDRLIRQELVFMSPYKLFVNYKKKINYFKSARAKLWHPNIVKFSHPHDLGYMTDLQLTRNNDIVIGFSMTQPHKLYQKYKVSPAIKLVATIKTNSCVDCRVNDKFLFCSSVSRTWMCYSWKSAKEIFSIQTSDYGFDGHKFPAFAESCDQCPVLALFDTNRIQCHSNGVGYINAKYIVPFVNEYCKLEFGIRLAWFKLDIDSTRRQSQNITQQILVSRNEKLCCGNEISECMPCSSHKMIFQLQDFRIFIYKIDTNHKGGPCSIIPTLLHVLQPSVELEHPFKLDKLCLSRDRTMLGYTCGHVFCWSSLDGLCNRCVSIKRNSLFTTVAVGAVLSVLAIVNTTFYQLVVVETGSGNIVHVFPDLIHIRGREIRSWNIHLVLMELNRLDNVT